MEPSHHSAQDAAMLARVAALPLFAGLDAASLQQVAAELEWLVMPGGEELFHESDPADAVYVLLAGSLGAFRGEGAEMRLVGRIHPGETVGEMALLSGHPRSATVRTLRDSELVRFSLRAFEALAQAHPQATLAIARTAVARLERALEGGRAAPAPRAIALLAVHPGIDVEAQARELAAALSRYGPVALLRGAEHAQAPIELMHELEQRHHSVIYVAEGASAEWRERCRRQADCLLLLADARHNPQPALSLPEVEAHQQAGLWLIQPGHILPGAARRWRQALGLSLHLHVRGREDIARLARRLARRSVGLVLSGGGARGFAHIGVIRALREQGLSIDAIGGTSIGAVMGAAVALEWDQDTVHDTFHRAFVATNPLSDYTLPLVALVAGRKASRLLQREFGLGDIEDLPLPYYCMSADLTDGKAVCHDQGPLWQALRASIAIPGILPPVCVAGQVLVDGGVIDNLPTGVMRERNPGPVIAVDIAGHHALAARRDEVDLPSAWTLLRESWRGQGRPNILRVLLRAGMVNSAATMEHNARHTDLLLRPPVDDIDLLAWQRFDDTIARGYRHALEVLAQWQQ